MYSHRYSPHRYSQPQLFACLVLKTFFKVDYRGLVALLREHSDLRSILDLKEVPHFTTLQKASKRLLRVPSAQRLFANTVQRFLKRRQRLKRVALDSTGLECGHHSLYYVRRRNGTLKRWQTVGYSRYAKLEVATDCTSHLLLAVLVGRGPRVDVDRFVPLLDATLAQVRLDAVLADAGYDSEPNHQHARQNRGVRSFMPATAGRPTTKPPTGRYRRLMKSRLNKNYGQVRATLAGRNQFFHAQTAPGNHCQRSQLLEPVSRTPVAGHHLQPYASLRSCRFSTEQLRPL
jgi:IS5 family transposase